MHGVAQTERIILEIDSARDALESPGPGPVDFPGESDARLGEYA